MYRNDNCSRRSWSQLDEEAVESMYERGFNSGVVENRVNCTDVEGEGRCSRSGEVQGHYTLNHVKKVLERILDGRIRKSVEMEIGEEQQGFRKGRGTTDGMFTLRQLV